MSDTEKKYTGKNGISFTRSDIAEEIKGIDAYTKEYGGVDSYTTDQAATICELIWHTIQKLGLDPTKREDFFETLKCIFRFELINFRGYEHGRFLLAPNHVSEFDGLIFGTIIPDMLVVAKSDWIQNPRLNCMIEKLFALTAVIRKDNASGMNVLRSCIEHFNGTENAAVTIFVQQTIADIDRTIAADVASGAYHIARKASAEIIPVYCEQVSTEAPTRIVFGDPIHCEDKDAFGEEWLKSERAMRDSISSPAARPPILCEKHRKPISERDF